MIPSVKTLHVSFKNNLCILCFLLAVFQLQASSSGFPSGDKTYLKSREIIFDALKPYSALHIHSLHSKNSSRETLVISSSKNHEIPEHVAIWLIQQQKYQQEIVVCNTRKEYFISEANAVSMPRKGRLERLIRKNLKPTSIFDVNGIKGTVMLQFLINQDGYIEKVHSTVSDDSLNAFEKKVLHVASRKGIIATSGYWKPATVNGQEVKKWMYLPVEFELKKNKTIVRFKNPSV